MSLDGSRIVRTVQDENDNQGDEALDPSELDTYAVRANWQEHNPNILDLNLVQFALAYYVSKGELRQEVIIRTFPNFFPIPSGQNYEKYCKYQLIKYKPWSGEVNNARNGLEDSDDIHIQCYHTFLTLDNAADYMPMLAQEQQQAQRYTDEEQDDDDEEDEEPQYEEEPNEWMLQCRLNQRYAKKTPLSRTSALTGRQQEGRCLLA